MTSPRDPTLTGQAPGAAACTAAPTPAENFEHERGSVAIGLAIMVMVLLMTAGLVVDGTGKLRAARKAETAAAEAARAAGQALDPAGLRGGIVTVSPAPGARAARAYLRTAGVTGTVAVHGRTVNITTHTTWRPVFLGAIGVGPRTMTGTASATAITRGAR